MEDYCQTSRRQKGTEEKRTRVDLILDMRSEENNIRCMIGDAGGHKLDNMATALLGRIRTDSERPDAQHGMHNIKCTATNAQRQMHSDKCTTTGQMHLAGKM